MAAAITGRGPAFDVRPMEARPLGFGGPIGGLAGFCKDTMQGACAGLLSLVGASHITATAPPIPAPGGGLATLEGVLQNFSAGGLAGPVELIGGIVLFLAARRTIARTLGVLGFIGFIVAYANGYELPEILAALSDILERASGALQSAAPGERA